MVNDSKAYARPIGIMEILACDSQKNNKTILLKPNKTMLKGLSLAFYESEESA